MFPKVFFLIATILSVLSTLNIPAISASEESVVTEIIIEGNRRSKDRYILSIIEISVGDKWYPGIEEEVKQNLLDEMLFQRETLKISSEKDGSGYRLHIYVEDRWTLLPIPVGSVSSDQWMAGLMLVERNFLGRGIMLNAGFIYGSDMMLGILMLGSENLTFGGGYMMSDREELTTAGGEAKVLRQYNLAMPYSFLKPSYRMRDWRFSWVFRYQGASVDWISGEAGVPIAEGNHYFITGPTISYSGLTHQSIFAKGFKADVSGLYYTPAYGSIVAGGSYAFFLGKTFWSISIDGGWGVLPVTDEFRLGGGQEGSLTLPKGISSSAYVQGTAKMELILIPIGSTRITGLVFYEAGVYEDLLNEIVPYHGPGIGLNLHLDRVAVPALGVTAAWNIPMNKPYISIQLGMRFR